MLDVFDLTPTCSMTSISELRYKTEVDLDVEIGARFVAALGPDGQAVVRINQNNSVVRVEQGKIVKDLYTGVDITGLLVHALHLFVLHNIYYSLVAAREWSYSKGLYHWIKFSS